MPSMCCKMLIQTNQIMRKDFLRKEMLGIAKLFIWPHISCKQGFNLVDVTKTEKDARKMIINGRNSELIDNVGTPKKLYVLHMPLHLMRPKSSKSFVEHTLYVARRQFRTRALQLCAQLSGLSYDHQIIRKRLRKTSLTREERLTSPGSGCSNVGQRYPADMYWGNQLHYSLDRDLSFPIFHTKLV